VRSGCADRGTIAVASARDYRALGQSMLPAELCYRIGGKRLSRYHP
jgi:hypothetical protein